MVWNRGTSRVRTVKRAPASDGLTSGFEDTPGYSCIGGDRGIVEASSSDHAHVPELNGLPPPVNRNESESLVHPDKRNNGCPGISNLGLLQFRQK